MAKVNTGTHIDDAPLVVALGPGFEAGKDCHAVVETNRGHDLGRVIWQGPAEPDTKTPGEIGGYKGARVLRAPADGFVHADVGYWRLGFGRATSSPASTACRLWPRSTGCFAELCTPRCRFTPA